MRGVDGAVSVREFRRVCSAANLTNCIPICNQSTYVYLLSIEIDGSGTMMTCNKVGDNFDPFFSAVIVGAAGTYMATLAENQTVSTDLIIQPGQVVLISGDRALASAPTWGSGGFTVGESASLSLSYLQVDTVIVMNDGALALSLDSCTLTFTSALVLRVATATFISQTFQGAIEVPNQASVSISTSSLAFAASSTGINVQQGGTLTLTGTTLATEDTDDARMVHVDSGGEMVVESCCIRKGDGSTLPLPCDGTLPTCASAHTCIGAVVLTGMAEVRTGALIICDQSSGECDFVTCGIASLSIQVINTVISREATFSADARGGMYSVGTAAAIRYAKELAPSHVHCHGGPRASVRGQ